MKRAMYGADLTNARCGKSRWPVVNSIDMAGFNCINSREIPVENRRTVIRRWDFQREFAKTPVNKGVSEDFYLQASAHARPLARIRPPISAHPRAPTRPHASPQGRHGVEISPTASN